MTLLLFSKVKLFAETDYLPDNMTQWTPEQNRTLLQSISVG